MWVLGQRLYLFRFSADKDKFRPLSVYKESTLYYAPAIIMAGALSVTPVRPYFTYNIRTSQRRPLSKSNTFDQNFFKLGHIV